MFFVRRVRSSLSNQIMMRCPMSQWETHLFLGQISNFTRKKSQNPKIPKEAMAKEFCLLFLVLVLVWKRGNGNGREEKGFGVL